MRTRIFIIFYLFISSSILSGCASSYERVMATLPDGGIAKVLNHSYDVVFPAAVRVMHLNKERIEEAVQRTGRIVSLGLFDSKGIFLKKLPGGRTRVEVSVSISRRDTSTFPGGGDAFFSQLKEQIIEYENMKVRRDRLSKKKVDPDLRRIYRSQQILIPILVCPDCAPPSMRIPYGRTVIKKRGLP